MNSETTIPRSDSWNRKGLPYLFEAQRFRMQISEEKISEVIKDAFLKELTGRIKELEKNDDEISISDSAAEELIKDQLNRLKKQKIREIDAIDIHLMTKLPVQQIGGIMLKLEKEGVVREDDGEE